MAIDSSIIPETYRSGTELAIRYINGGAKEVDINELQWSVSLLASGLKKIQGPLEFRVGNFMEAMFADGVPTAQRVDAAKAINAVLGVQEDDDAIKKYADVKEEFAKKLTTAVKEHENHKPDNLDGLLKQAKKKLAEQASEQEREIEGNNPLNTYKSQIQNKNEQKALRKAINQELFRQRDALIDSLGINKSVELGDQVDTFLKNEQGVKLLYSFTILNKDLVAFAVDRTIKKFHLDLNALHIERDDLISEVTFPSKRRNSRAKGNDDSEKDDSLDGGDNKNNKFRFGRGLFGAFLGYNGDIGQFSTYFVTNVERMVQQFIPQYQLQDPAAVYWPSEAEKFQVVDSKTGRAILHEPDVLDDPSDPWGYISTLPNDSVDTDYANNPLHYIATHDGGEFDRDGADTPQKQNLKEAVVHALKTLSYREREILRAHKGLNGGSSSTLEELGKIFKVTRERVRQIEAKAVRKLQQPSRSADLEPYWEQAKKPIEDPESVRQVAIANDNWRIRVAPNPNDIGESGIGERER